MEGVVLITQTQIAHVTSELKLSLLSAIRQENQTHFIMPSTTTVGELPSDGVKGYELFWWKNKHHPLPEGFIFPR
jgi:hypothetical protein